MPITTALTADATAVYDAFASHAEHPDVRRIGRQRFVPLLHLRTTLNLPGNRFERAVNELASTYHGWLQVDWHSTADDDAASVRHHGTDYHLLSVDPWNA